MFEQNLLLRQTCSGQVPAIPARHEPRHGHAQVWLDSNQNVTGQPNENYAREVMELFSLGVGNYTEKDIQEAARAFTGWHVDARTDADEDTFRFKPVLHDNASKTVFGQTGNWNGDDIVAFCCDRPDLREVPRRQAVRLLRQRDARRRNRCWFRSKNASANPTTTSPTW